MKHLTSKTDTLFPQTTVSCFYCFLLHCVVFLTMLLKQFKFILAPSFSLFLKKNYIYIYICFLMQWLDSNGGSICRLLYYILSSPLRYYNSCHHWKSWSPDFNSNSPWNIPLIVYLQNNFFVNMHKHQLSLTNILV